MSRSNDPGHYFQTTDSLATTERKAAKAHNKRGDPVRLPSKILALCPDVSASNARGVDRFYAAEAAGEIKAITFDSATLHRVFTRGDAPLTCLALLRHGDDNIDKSDARQVLFAGSWDKSIYAITLAASSCGNAAAPQGVRRLQGGHADFVKCLVCATLDGRPVLISGGADATITVWDVSDGERFGTVLHKLKGHSKAVQDLVVDVEVDDNGNGDPHRDPSAIVLFSASSDREIRKWHVSRAAAHELAESIEKPIRAHETSVYKLRFDADGDLWTASADKTAKHLVRGRDWAADTVLEHSDFVRDVLPFEELGLVVTACRDEEVRVWDVASGKLVCTYSGHYEEVTGLLRSRDGRSVFSASIDGTVRRWSLDRAEMVRYQEEMAKEASGEAEPANDEKQKGSMLTAEEEAELAELMDDDD